jgi:hypothetical protein
MDPPIGQQEVAQTMDDFRFPWPDPARGQLDMTEICVKSKVMLRDVEESAERRNTLRLLEAMLPSNHL